MIEFYLTRELSKMCDAGLRDLTCLCGIEGNWQEESRRAEANDDRYCCLLPFSVVVAVLYGKTKR